MPMGFTSPSILFLNTWDSPERSYCEELLGKLRIAGYRRYVEPCAGAFVMPIVARAAGWQPVQIEASDVSLYSSISGFLLANKDLDGLGITVDGEPLALDGPPIYQAATILWAQLKLRMECRPQLRYWQEIVRDLEDRKEEHLEALSVKLRGLHAQLGGLKYEAEDIWAHVDRVKDDPQTVINVNPPTYKSGFEKFFDTKSRLKWSEPTYSVWDPPVDVPRLLQRLEGAPALLLCQQQVPPRQASHPRPIYARHLSPGQNVYFLCNRPDEVEQLVGIRVKARKMVDFEKLAVPSLPAAYPITPLTTIAFEPISPSQAAYYKELWLHRISPKSALYNFAVYLDGYIAGTAGYSLEAMRDTWNTKRWLDALVLVYGVGAPHADRLTRLISEMALQRSVFKSVVAAQWSAPATQIITSEFTRYPEAKGLRGLMKLATRTKDKQHGFKLVYVADVGEKSPQEVLENWYAKEVRYRKQKGGTE